MTQKKEIAVSRLRELFLYDSDTGNLVWKTTTWKVKAGDRAGYITDKGYLRVSVDGVRIYAHRIVWAIHHGEWPTSHIDHKNLIKSDNRIDNLRQASVIANAQNRLVRSDSAVHMKGVGIKDGRYRSRIKVNGSEKSLGRYATAEEAYEVYCLASDMLHGEFSNHG